MRIEQLEYIAAVTRHGSLRRASERLHISQPALSEAVSKLERELGVLLLDRRRSGARISREGRELLHHMVEVLEAVDRLKVAAGDRGAGARHVRVGTVNVLGGDDPPVDLLGTDLLHGRPVVVLPADHRLATQQLVSVDDLRAERFIAMRAGYLMHRFAHRIFGSQMPATCHSTDGAEMGKTLVAEGLGLTLLPDYSVVGDPMERAGLITTRPIAGDHTVVTLVLRQRTSVGPPAPLQVRSLRAALIARAREYADSLAS